MEKSLIYLDEDLASSIALRFAAQQAKQTGMLLDVIHVEEPTDKGQSGTGWVRRTWEQGVEQAGREAVERLLKTEKVEGRFAGPTKVKVGKREREIVEELRHNAYGIYVEGYLNTANPNDFYEFLDSRRFREMQCPVMIVKNLVAADRLLVLLSEGVDTESLLADLAKLYERSMAETELTVLYYSFKETPELRFLEKDAMGVAMGNIEEALAKSGWAEPEILVVQGTPEQAAAYVRDHGLVVSSFPTRTGVRAELLALVSNPILLFKQAKKVPEKE